LKITVWRIFKKKHQAFAFTGEGARRFGGRWNSKGVAVVYASQSPALAALEMLVHLEAQHLRQAYLFAPISFDSSLIEHFDLDQLPKTWRKDPPPRALRDIGDEWVAGARSVVLRVPSAIIASESNYLLNPSHPSFKKCAFGAVVPFRFDPRLK
jgi:RES domain-containing protein